MPGATVPPLHCSICGVSVWTRKTVSTTDTLDQSFRKDHLRLLLLEVAGGALVVVLVVVVELVVGIDGELVVAWELVLVEDVADVVTVFSVVLLAGGGGLLPPEAVNDPT